MESREFQGQLCLLYGSNVQDNEGIIGATPLIGEFEILSRGRATVV